MPAEHDLDPDAMTEKERLAKRRYQAWFAFETMPGPDVPDEQSGSAEISVPGRSADLTRKEG